jgi:spore germination cell wall hydrolase CwlJ-like protein
VITDTLASLIVAGALMLHPEPLAKDLDQMLCVAEAIWFEASGEPLQGKYVVAHVIRNRKNSARFPNTLCEVVNQRKQFSYLNKCRPKVVINNHIDALAFEWSVRIAIDLVNDTLGGDFTGGADHYYNPKKANPSWAQYGEVVGKVGNHLLLKNVIKR